MHFQCLERFSGSQRRSTMSDNDIITYLQSIFASEWICQPLYLLTRALQVPGRRVDMGQPDCNTEMSLAWPLMTSDVPSSRIVSIHNDPSPLWPSLPYDDSKPSIQSSRSGSSGEVRPRNQLSTRAFVRQQNRHQAETSTNLTRTVRPRRYQYEPLLGPRSIRPPMLYPAAGADKALCCSFHTAQLEDDLRTNGIQ